MADHVHQENVNILGGDANLVHAENIVSGPVTDVVNGEEVIQDILQQAFQEASGPYVQETASYSHGEVTLADGTTTLALSAAGKDENGEVIYTLSSGDIGVNLPNDDHEIHCITSDQINGNAEQTAFLQQVVADGIGNHVVAQGEQIVVQLQEGELIESFPQTVDEETSERAALPQTAVSVGVTQSVLRPTVINETAQMPTSLAIVSKPVGTVTTLPQPLGSSNNPIRIVQQGSQYTSLQQLTSEQLSQIMQVVQQQQLVKTTQNPANDSAVLYNPQTKTRIVYRVIYPSELHKRPGDASTSTPTSTPTTTTTAAGNIRRTICVPTDSVFVEFPKRTYRKRNKNDEDDKVDAPELSREEKDEKKKHRPRTRSGRVSRPPKHMIKDYKHIHPVDWDEDYDDSDGGYSDFQPSSGEGDEEGNAPRRRKDGSYMPYSLIGHGKNKPWKCQVCDKAYIGKAGLARHYRLAPEHGKDDENFKDTGFLLGADSSNSLDSMPGSVRESLSDKSYEEDKNPMNKTDITNQVPTGSGPTTCTTTTASNSVPILTAANKTSSSPHVAPKVVLSNGQSTEDKLGQNTLKGILKSKQIHIQDSIPLKKKARLKEFIRDFSDEDLMEVILPRLSRAVSTWEFLLMKVERGRPARPQLVDLLQEYAQLYRSIHRMTEQQLHPVTPDRKVPAGTTQIQISDSMVATSLGLSTGMYTVEVPPRKEDTFRYKLLTTDPDNIHNPSAKRTLQTVASQELFTSPAKRPRIESNQGGSPKKWVPLEKQLQDSLKPGQTVLKPKITAFIQARRPPTEAKEDLIETRQNHQPLDKLTKAELEEVESNAMKVEEVVNEAQTNGNQSLQPTDESRVMTSNTNQDSDVDNVVKTEHIEAGNFQVRNYGSVTVQGQENHLEPVLNDMPAHGELSQDTQQALTESSATDEPQTLPRPVNEDEPPQAADMMSNPVCSGSPNIESQFEARELTSDECPKQTDEVKMEQGTEDTEWVHVEYNENTNQVQLVEQQQLTEAHVHRQEDQKASLSQFDSHVSTADSVPLSVQYNEPLIENNITEQYITENGLILQAGGATQVLVQEESFLNQNGTPEQEHDLALEGDGQDLNEDNRLILIKNPDGTIQIHRQGNQPVSLEMLQALLGMELDIPTAAAETSESL